MRASTAAVGLAIFLVTSPARAAAPSTGARCQLKKAVAAGNAVRAILGCHAEGARHGVPEDASCVAAAHAKMAGRFARLDAGGRCVSAGDAGEIAVIGDRIVFFTRLDLPRPTAPSSCSARRLKAVGRMLEEVTRLRAADELQPNPAGLATREERSRARFVATFEDAVRLGDCLATDSIGVLGIVDYGRTTIMGRLFDHCGDGVKGPGEDCDYDESAACPGHCNLDCTCPHCGDDRVNVPSEQCDGPEHDACGSSPCQPDCLCPAPLCGDGLVNQPSEQCDGADDGGCHGLCRSDCSCPTPECGNLVTEAGEICDGPGSPCQQALGQCLPPGSVGECTCCFEFCRYLGLDFHCCPGKICVFTEDPVISGLCVTSCHDPTDCGPPYDGCRNGRCCIGSGNPCFFDQLTYPCCNGCGPGGTCL